MLLILYRNVGIVTDGMSIVYAGIEILVCLFAASFEIGKRAVRIGRPAKLPVESGEHVLDAAFRVLRSGFKHRHSADYLVAAG